MKKFSAPPMIIILDVLFVVLFILVLDTSPDMKLILPKDVWLKDMVAVSLDKDRKMAHWFNTKHNSWETFDSYPKSKRKFSFIIGNTDCEKNKFCKELPSIADEEKKIYVTGNLYDELSGMISDSCLTFPKQCSNVTYHITDEGTVDKDRLKKDYQIFRFILR
jgi:hypothetical protein